MIKNHKTSYQAELSLYNSLGINVLQDELHDNKGQKTIDIRGLTKGVYIYTIKCAGLTTNGKLVVTN